MRIYSAFLNKKTKMNDGIIKIIDFERLMYALRDFELDILYRMIRKTWKFASEETEQFTDSVIMQI